MKSAHLSLLPGFIVVLAVACSSTSSESNSTGNSDSGAMPHDATTAERDAGVADGAVPSAKGPTFVVQAESLSVENPAAPAGQSSSYTVKTDSTVLEGGAPSMLLSSTDGATETSFAATTGTLAIDGKVTGRRYRMRAKIKTEDATSAWLWWRIDGNGFFELDNMGRPVDRRIKGTSDWQQVSLVMDVPNAATGFAFGSGLTGLGKVWVGAITFDEVGSDVPTTPHFGNTE